jgi:tetratricopeptide (TPR) repeat protein
MGLNKEQVLLLCVLGLGLWQYKSLTTDAATAASYEAGRKQHAAAAVPQAALAGTATVAPLRRDLFREPSETQPLPPRALPFPDRPPASLVALPLDPGPDLGHAEVLRMPGDVVAGVSLAGPFEGERAAESGGGASGAGAAGTGAGQDPSQQGWEHWASTYDQIWVTTLPRSPYLGVIEHPDKIALEAQRAFAGETVRMRVFSPRTQRLGALQLFGDDHKLPIGRIELARTLRNEVERRKRRVPETAVHLPERQQLIEWLLERAEEESWVYDEALDQAEVYLRVSGGDLEGFRLRVRVLRARGDLAGEYALYQDLPERLQESAFRYEGLGGVKAALGLHAEAEQDLRKAVQLAPSDPRPRAGLAEFLLARGHARQAAHEAERALAGLGMITSATDRARVLTAFARCQLAVADVAAARQALSGAADASVRASLVLLPGAIDYAAGDLDAALQAFRQASAAGAGPAAILGAGACLLRLQQWQEAQAAFEAVADQAPLLRARALAGMGLLALKIGQREQAVQWLDRSLEADPTDAYVHYLRGRALRELAQLPQAQEALQAALRLRDDFLHALAEMALVRWRMAQDARGREAAVHLVAAVRYADRVVALSHKPSREFLELQGALRGGRPARRGGLVRGGAGRRGRRPGPPLRPRGAGAVRVRARPHRRGADAAGPHRG